MVMALGAGLRGVAPVFPAILIASAVGGIGCGVVFPPWTTLLQTLTPATLRGRVFAASDAVEQSMNSIGTLLAAPLISAVGIRPTYLVIGALAAVAAACLYRATGTTSVHRPSTTTSKEPS